MTETAAPLDLAEVEARIERNRCHAGNLRPAAAEDLSHLIDHDAPALAAALRRITTLHAEFKIYSVCGHRHTEVDAFVRDVADVGLVCEEGYLYSICRHCCTDACGDQTEECIAAHIHADSICPTRDALTLSSDTSGADSRTALDRLVDAAEDVLAEAEQAETDAVFSGKADPARLGTPALKALREAILALPADTIHNDYRGSVTNG